jgi:hypothetical protein
MPTTEPTWFEFIETPIFTKRLTELALPEVLTAIQANLIEDPERWPVVQSTGGARKGRIADPRSGRGKSGGYRYLYLYLSHAGVIYLMYIFGKNEQSDLTPTQKKMIAELSAWIREEWQ